MNPHLVVIGNPNCRRVAYWKAAAARLRWPDVEIVSYAGLCENRGTDFSPGTVVRIESPGGDWDLFKRMLKHGIAPAENEGYPALDERAYRSPRIRTRMVDPAAASTPGIPATLGIDWTKDDPIGRNCDTIDRRDRNLFRQTRVPGSPRRGRACRFRSPSVRRDLTMSCDRSRISEARGRC